MSTRIGGSAFNHSQSANSEAEYDRLRDLARKEQSQHQHYAAEARQCYERGDGSGAHEASAKSKEYAAKADGYNKQASDYIFRENNAIGRVEGDTVDLHGQFVEEAEEIVTQRIKYAQQNGQTHLHVIVGKGNHSANHIQKIKPAVENICRDLGLQYSTEQNEGRMYIDLTGGQAIPPTNYGQQQLPNQNNQQYGQPHYETAYPYGGQVNYGSQQQQQGYGQQQQYNGQQQQYNGQQQQYNGQQQQQYNGQQQQYNNNGQQQQYNNNNNNGQQQYNNNNQQQQQQGEQQQQGKKTDYKAMLKKYMPQIKRYAPQAFRFLKKCFQ